MKSILTTLVLSSMVASSAFAGPASKHSNNKAAVEAAQEALAPDISLVELRSIVEKNKKAKPAKPVVIIDANSESSYKSGHIPGAVHYAAIEKDFAKSLPADKDALIIAYCGSPMCTAWEEPAKKAKELGYTNIRHLKAGIKGWRDAKYETQS